VVSPSPSDRRDAVNPLVAFYNIHGRKREVLLFCSVPDTTRDMEYIIVSFHTAGMRAQYSRAHAVASSRHVSRARAIAARPLRVVQRLRCVCGQPPTIRREEQRSPTQIRGRYALVLHRNPAFELMKYVRHIRLPQTHIRLY
jgi:hypothetical protein